MSVGYLAIGLGLQAWAIVIAWACGRLLYAISWLGVLVLAVPAFLAGVGFVLASGAWWPVRALLGGWPLAWPLYSVGRYAVERRRMWPEVFLVPVGYAGEVAVEFDAADGAPEEREGGSRVYRIGPDGTLRTRAACPRFASTSLNQDRSNGRRVFAVDAAGARVELERPESLNLDAPNDDGRPIVGATTEYYDGRRVLRVTLDVGTRAQLRERLR